ncbi:hypothetical protein M0R19_05705 [Candidatus Pacearchaeota archaeon]|nr:hypothetical protein [Candidatus Pacearchaeota archaeon]
MDDKKVRIFCEMKDCTMLGDMLRKASISFMTGGQDSEIPMPYIKHENQLYIGWLEINSFIGGWNNGKS